MINKKIRVPLKEALLKEALVFLRKNRAEDLSLRLLAKRLKVSPMALYRHFQNKEDLLAAIVASGFDELTQRFQIALKDRKDFWKSFRRLGKAYVDFVIENPDHSRLMFSGLLSERGKHPEAEECGDRAFAVLMEMVLHGQQEGYLKKSDPFKMAYTIWATVHGYSSLLLERQLEDADPPLTVDSMLTFMTEMFREGLRP